jgi:hypothetical protein
MIADIETGLSNRKRESGGIKRANDHASAAAVQEVRVIDRDGTLVRTDSQNRHGTAVGLEAIVGRLVGF